MQVVRGAGFSFAAPAGWQVTRGSGGTQAAAGPELVRVSTFKLLRPYTDALFDRVSVELRLRMAQIARESHGVVAGSTTVTAAGIRSHSYEVHEDGGLVDQYTFVLRDSREYELLCRRKSSSSNAFCDRLVRTFATA